MKRAEPDFNNARPTLSLTAVQGAINLCSEDTVDMMEVECIIANLIARKLVKGVISHSKQVLVLSPSAVPSKAAFPPLKLVRS